MIETIDRPLPTGLTREELEVMKNKYVLELKQTYNKIEWLKKEQERTQDKVEAINAWLRAWY